MTEDPLLEDRLGPHKACLTLPVGAAIHNLPQQAEDTSNTSCKTWRFLSWIAPVYKYTRGLMDLEPRLYVLLA